MGAPREVLDLVKSRPDGVSVAEVAGSIGISSGGARTILWTLQDVGLLQFVPQKRIRGRRGRSWGLYKLED